MGEPVRKYQFDGFELFPIQRALLRDGVRVLLTGKPIDTLLLLVERAGETVSKDDLLALVWNGAAIEENNLSQSVSALRRALGEKRGENRYIVTDSGRGYRFVASVERVMERDGGALLTSQAMPESTGNSVFDAEARSTRGKTRREPRSKPESTEQAEGAERDRFWAGGRGSERPGRSQRVFAVAGVLAVLLAGSAWLTLRRPAPNASARRSVAVLRIRDLSKTSSEAWLQTALTEMLTSELAAGGKLRAIPAEDVARWRTDLGVAAEDGRLGDLLHSALRNLGADTMVLGSYVVTGTCPDCRVRVDLGVMNARSGERLGTVIEEGSAADLLDLTGRLGRGLRGEFGVTAEIAASPRWPASSAMREYAEGLKALRGGDPLAARDHLEAAAAADQGNALIHSALADAWTALGYGTRANEENRRAYELAGSLDRLGQLGIEARYRGSMQQWDRAGEVYKAIFQLFPDSLDDGLNLARAQMLGNHIADDRTTLRALRKLPAPAGNDPRIDLAEAAAAGIENDYPRTRDLAHRAAEEAQARGARYLFARARLLEGGAMQTLADAGYAAVQDEARGVCEQIGDRDCVSKAWRIRGNERYYKGDFPAAQEAYSKGVAIAREIGNRGELANLLEGFAVVARANRDWAQTEKDLLEAVSLREETGFNPSEVETQLGELYLRMGRLPEAEKVLGAAHEAAERAGAHEDLGEVFRLQARMAQAKGQLDRASELSDHAVAELRGTGAQTSLILALAESSSVATARGDLAKAERDLTEAGAGAFPEVDGAVHLARAELWEASGRLQDAAAEAQRAAASWDKAHEDEQAARASLIAADALEMLHRDEQALAQCREGGARAAQSPNLVVVTLARLCEWRLSAASWVPWSDLKSPEVALGSAYAEAMRAKRTGAADARRLFAELARQAAARGYVTFSKRALSLAAAN